jgi:hypothetical protein
MKKPATIIRQLQKLSKNCLITGKENTRPFECDGLSVYRQKPLAVVLPQSVEQIKQQCTPPEFSATLPPIVQAIWLDGSGA